MNVSVTVIVTIIRHTFQYMDRTNVFSEIIYIYIIFGPGSSVGLVTDYGLDGPGSNPGGGEMLRPSRPPLGPTQRPVKWVPGLSLGSSAAGACC